MVKVFKFSMFKLYNIKKNMKRYLATTNGTVKITVVHRNNTIYYEWEKYDTPNNKSYEK